jgi:hypothetical protein
VVTDGTTLFFYPIANYIWGPDRVLAKLDNLTGNRYYYIYNGHGDVVQILDTAGNIVNSYDYDIWGNFITKDETIHNPFTYLAKHMTKARDCITFVQGIMTQALGDLLAKTRLEMEQIGMCTQIITL